ncbi:membrane spanning protein [hydrocarbon metagenome]|uniref:Membrane spanning protein n=1 Tax=hydrocarbon metagenome TaxID=938273 RepID=A0A0W8E450_9ZZZZ
MSVLIEKLKEVLFAVLPITLIVLIINYSIIPLETNLVLRFILGALLIILGLSIFLFGVDIGIIPIGHFMGSSLSKAKNIWIVALVGLILGFFISIAEPDLHIIAGQIELVTSGLISKLGIIIIVSLGIAIMFSLGLIRIIKGIALYKILIILYTVILALALFTTPEFLAISFDTSGATTGALTVPFIMAMAIGISALKKNSQASEEDSFGLVALASIGPIISVMIMSILFKTDKISGIVEYQMTYSDSIIGPFISKLPTIATEAFFALLPLLVIFLLFQIAFKVEKKALRKILKGLIYTFSGLVLFLIGVNAGFMDVGRIMGNNIASLHNNSLIIFIGFILGLVTILAEPAVHVLTHQIEDITSGYVKRPVVISSISIGVGFAVALSMIRIIIPEIQLWHFLLPGYIIAISMTFLVPPLFVGIAFDSGGVASGPMTVTFILAFAQGVAESVKAADVLVDGFGMIALVALTPLIALQIVGYIFKIKSVKGGIESDG